MSLEQKSLTELRGIAQSLEIGDVFNKPANILLQEIRKKQQVAMPEPKVTPPSPVIVVSSEVVKSPDDSSLTQLLAGHVDLGLVVTFPEPNEWHMAYKGKEDCGNMQQPLVNILKCADRLMKK